MTIRRSLVCALSKLRRCQCIDWLQSTYCPRTPQTYDCAIARGTCAHIHSLWSVIDRALYKVSRAWPISPLYSENSYKFTPSLEPKVQSHHTQVCQQRPYQRKQPRRITRRMKRCCLWAEASEASSLTRKSRSAPGLCDCEKIRDGPELDKRTTCNSLNVGVESMSKPMYRPLLRCRQLPEK